MKDKKKRNLRIRWGAIKRGQFIAPFGVGSIVDLPDESVMPASIDLWPLNIGTMIYDERLQRRLRVDYFRMVPAKTEFKEGIPFFRFPKWLFCPKCRTLRHISDWRNRYKSLSAEEEETRIPICDQCKVKLVPSRFVVACEKGHIDDFPWIDWVHKKKGTPCPSPELKLSTGGGSSGLIGISVSCKCGEEETMAGAFNKDAHTECTGNKPWIASSEKCNMIPKTLQRGASNVYFPQVVSSIVIPPYSDDLIAEIRRTTGFAFLASQEGAIDDKHYEFIIKTIADSVKKNVKEIKSIINRLLGEDNPEVIQTENAYRYDEYQAFQGNIDNGSIDSNDFRIEIRDGNEYSIPGLEKVILVHRLREVRSLVAFSRINPLERGEVLDDDYKHDSYAVPVKENKGTRWLPAMEVRGEGIFLLFDETALKEWEELNGECSNRANKINDRYNLVAQERGRETRHFSAKFIFLHTFAHLLIRQLSFECGYGSASLRERIYCDENKGEPQMAGILIYTANGDSEGTLGGLVRQGKPQFLPSIIKSAVRNALWCSSDPLCIESLGQGLDSLNLAACHACALLPETSCEEFNRKLDRGLVVGLPQEPEMGFMYKLLL